MFCCIVVFKVDELVSPLMKMFLSDDGVLCWQIDAVDGNKDFQVLPRCFLPDSLDSEWFTTVLVKNQILSNLSFVS